MGHKDCPDAALPRISVEHGAGRPALMGQVKEVYPRSMYVYESATRSTARTMRARKSGVDDAVCQ
jgi:hypothetical protein